MEKIDIKKVIESKSPDFLNQFPKSFSKFIIKFFERFLRINEINEFIDKAKDKFSMDFVIALFEHLNVKFEVNVEELKRIPSEGKLIIVSNHPLGGLDGLALVSIVKRVRKDVRIVANDLLQNVKNINDLFLPVDLESFAKQKHQLKLIDQAFNNDEAVIFFPSGKVSRLYPDGIHDRKWRNGATKYSSKFDVPILPIYVKARNSFLFYLLSMIHTNIGMFMLPQELFRKRNKTFTIKIGELIPSKVFTGNTLKPKIQSKLLKQHTYRIGRGKEGIFNTEQTIIHPVNPEVVANELHDNINLGLTIDGKSIFLVDYSKAKNVILEISRLRELTFRKVGEGTNKPFDMDIYDIYYKHIVLWDEENREIIGSYRLGSTKEIIDTYTKKGLYNSSQFVLTDYFDEILEQSIEVGRSFIQQKYWKSNALDYIWQGIGAYLSDKPEIKYLWGAVSISNSYSELAKGLIIQYYRKWYSGNQFLVKPIFEYEISSKILDDVNSFLVGNDHTEDLKFLKLALKNIGFSIPVLYRKYTELTEYGGSTFISFCIDHHFNNSIDGLILVDLQRLKSEFRERYYKTRSLIIN